MRRLIYSLAVVLALLLTGCGGNRDSFCIVGTTDIHGNIFSMDFVSDEPTPVSGGLARFSSFIDRQRKEWHKRVFYVDCGDILEGSPWAYYERTADYDQQSTTASVLDYLGCDVSVPGNHDLKVGINSFDRFVRSSSHPVICANFIYDSTPYEDEYDETGLPSDNPESLASVVSGDQPVLPPYAVIEKKGVRVAFIGLLTPSTVLTQSVASMEGFKLTDMKQAANKYVQIVREKESPDFIVGVFHAGLDDDRYPEPYNGNVVLSLAKEVPGFDAIFYGHDHIPMDTVVTNVEGNAVALLNPGGSGTRAACLEVQLHRGKGNAVEKTMHGYLAEITDEPDSRMINRYSSKITALQNYMDSVLGYIDIPVSTQGNMWRMTSMADYQHYEQLRGTSAQISLASPQSADQSLEAGPVTPKDMYRIFPYENTVSTLMLTGEEIRNFLEYVCDAWFNTVSSSDEHVLDVTEMSDGSLSLNAEIRHLFTAQGINYITDVTRPDGQKVTVISMADGKPFDEKTLYRTAMNSYYSAGGDQILSLGTGIPLERLHEREMVSTRADLRFHAITRLGVSAESDNAVHPVRSGSWRVVPEIIVAESLGRDTLLLHP